MLLTISVKTVEKHRYNLMDKLNIRDVAGLVRFAIGQRQAPTAVTGPCATGPNNRRIRPWHHQARFTASHLYLGFTPLSPGYRSCLISVILVARVLRPDIRHDNT